MVSSPGYEAMVSGFPLGLPFLLVYPKITLFYDLYGIQFYSRTWSWYQYNRNPLARQGNWRLWSFVSLRMHFPKHEENNNFLLISTLFKSTLYWHLHWVKANANIPQEFREVSSLGNFWCNSLCFPPWDHLSRHKISLW